ncbi:MAG: poly(3-hydroxyalkanoate) depolymerase [Rhizobiaceae bacterium]
MRIQFATFGSQTIRYAECGPENASQAILLFNGIGANVETAAAFMGQFRGTRVITFDVPGVGESPTPLFPYRYFHMARLAAKLLDHLGINAVDVFGVSWGGGLAQQFAHDFRHRVNRLVLAATSAGMAMVPGRVHVLSKLLTPKRYSDPEFMTRIGPEMYGGLLRENEELMAEHLDAISHSSPRGYVFQLLAISGWTSWHWLPRLDMPTLVIMGDDDPIVPKVNGQILVSRLPNAELISIECGHLFIVTLPQETASLVEDFLNRNDVSAG